MGEVTGISWTDHTFNPWWGCTKVSAGCDNCYAESFDKRVGGAHWGKGMPRRVFGDKHWNEPLKWDHMAEKEGRKHMVFCASMADVMDDEAPEGARARLWDVIDDTPNLMWQLLTKRPQRYEKYLPPAFAHSELIRREMMADFSDKLSMEEISTCAYRIVENYLSTPPLPPPQARTPHTTDDLAKEYEGVSPKGISYLEWLELEVLKARRAASAPQEAK